MGCNCYLVIILGADESEPTIGFWLSFWAKFVFAFVDGIETIGTAVSSTNKFLFGYIRASIKLISGNSAGTVTTFYVSRNSSSSSIISLHFIMYHMRAYWIYYHHNSVDLELPAFASSSHLISSLDALILVDAANAKSMAISLHVGLPIKTLTIITHYEVCTPHNGRVGSCCRKDHLKFFLWDNNWNKCYSMPKNTQGHRYPIRRKKLGVSWVHPMEPKPPHYANIGRSS